MGQVHTPRCQKLKDLSNGVVWCRLMGKLRPGALATILVINRPANANDSMHNYMLLESAFAKAKIPWYFDSRALTDGSSDELYRLAKSFAEIGATDAELLPLPVPPFLSNGQPRHPAGENESSEYVTSTQPSKEPSQLDLSELAGESQSDQLQVSSELQLKQHLEDMFYNQQAAVDAYFAEQCPSATTLPAAIKIMCFCNKCQSQVRAIVGPYSTSNAPFSYENRPLV